MGNLIIRKKAPLHFWHESDDGIPDFLLSDWQVAVDADKFQVKEINGQRRYEYDWSVITVIDETTSTTYPPTNKYVLIQTLINIKYTPFLTDQQQVQTIILRKGMGSDIDCDAAYISANFDASGLGINEMEGWAMRNGNNNTKNRVGRVPIGFGAIPTTGANAYTSVGAVGGYKDAAVIVHKHTTFANARFVGISGGQIGVALGSGAYFNITGMDQTDNQGVSGTDRNMQPYIVTVMIERVYDLVVYGNGSVVTIGDVVEAGTNVTITGTGTAVDPKVINALGGGSSYNAQWIERTKVRKGFANTNPANVNTNEVGDVFSFGMADGVTIATFAIWTGGTFANDSSFDIRQTA